MKLLVGLTVVCLVAARALGEDCFETGECVVTECSGANSVVCEIPSDGGSGKCTCAIAEACDSRTDCYAPAHTELNCDDSQRHCYDSACICSVFGGGGSIGGGFFPGGGK